MPLNLTLTSAARGLASRAGGTILDEHLGPESSQARVGGLFSFSFCLVSPVLRTRRLVSFPAKSRVSRKLSESTLGGAGLSSGEGKESADQLDLPRAGHFQIAFISLKRHPQTPSRTQCVDLAKGVAAASVSGSGPRVLLGCSRHCPARHPSHRNSGCSLSLKRQAWTGVCSV